MDELASKQAITEVIYRYCRAVDRLDIPLGHSIWHEGAVADYGQGFYYGPGPGVIDLICRQHSNMLHHSHQVTNILIDVDGNRAASEAYCTASLRVEREGVLQQITVWNRYIDHWSFREGRWAIDKRVVVKDFDEIRAVTEMQRHDVGRRDRTDPSYSALPI